MAPHSVSFRSQRRDQRCKKLIANRSPVGIRQVLLIKRLRRARTDSEHTTSATEPVNIDTFCFAIDAPNQPRIIRIILGMNGRGRAQRDEITGVHIGLWTTVDNDRHPSQQESCLSSPFSGGMKNFLRTVTLSDVRSNLIPPSGSRLKLNS